MNAEILKRLFRAVSEGSDESLRRRVCGVIVADVKRKHHQTLAEQLEQILFTQPLESKQIAHIKSMLPEIVGHTLPISKKNHENLISIFSRQELEHYMVLPSFV